MDIEKESNQIIYNVITWVEVNRQLRASWVRENFTGFFIQLCKPFKENLGTYNWNNIFKAKNIITRFDADGKLIGVEVACYNTLSAAFLSTINRYFKYAIQEVELNGLPASVTGTIIDRLDRVKRMGLPEPNNIVMIDMRKLDAISFRPSR